MSKRKEEAAQLAAIFIAFGFVTGIAYFVVWVVL